jgi:hypothetical protein
MIYEAYFNKTYLLLDAIEFFGGGIPFLIAGVTGFLQVFIVYYILRRENQNPTPSIQT